MKFFVSCFFILISVTAASAQTYICTSNGKPRHVTIPKAFQFEVLSSTQARITGFISGFDEGESYFSTIDPRSRSQISLTWQTRNFNWAQNRLHQGGFDNTATQVSSPVQYRLNLLSNGQKFTMSIRPNTAGSPILARGKCTTS